MPIGNLFHVTDTLIRLLDLNVERLVSGGPVNTVSRPPESLTGQTRALNLFLYHVAEDPNYKNQPPVGSGTPPVATTPMALILYYILTAHHEANSAFDASVEQEIFGAALKTLHDFPFVDEATAVPGQGPVMNANLIAAGGAGLEISMRPVTPEEALSFWSTEQHQTARLSAYYEVRAVFLEPEPPTSYPGIVQSVGSYVFPINAPLLVEARSTMSVTPPPATGLMPYSLMASPARPLALTPAEIGGSTAADLILRGSSLSVGTRQSVVLRHSDFSRLTPPQRSIVVDPALNAVNGWSIDIRSEEAAVTFGSALTYVDETGTQATIPLYPGTYMMSVEAEIGAYEQGTRRRPILERSNGVPVLRGANIIGATAVAANGDFTLNISPAFDLARGNGVDPDELDIVLVVSGVAYTRVLNAGAITGGGQFAVSTTAAGAPGPDGLTLYAAATVSAQGAFDPSVPVVHPVRLIIDGVDATPFWLEV